MATMEEQAKLDAFMSKGWPYPKAGNMVVGSKAITDGVIDRQYKLAMSEVTEY